MSRARIHLIRPIFATLCVSLTGASVATSAEYDIVSLGTLGGTFSHANAISPAGTVFGWATTAPGVKHPTHWDNGGIVDLGSPPGFVVGEAIAGNDAGQITVFAEGNSQSHVAFFWEANTWTNIGVLPGRSETIPTDIDPDGRIVGFALTHGAGNQAAFLWESNELIDLGTLGGATAQANAINAGRQIAGWAHIPEVDGIEPVRAFRWEDGQMTDLGLLPDHEHSQATDINDAGDVVGSSWIVTIPLFLNADRATLWRNGGEIVDLGLTPGPQVCVDGFPFYTDNIARAVNNLGQVVGDAQCVVSGASKAGFLWEDGQMRNLNDLVPLSSGWNLLSARDINDAGEIVGIGIAPSGSLEAFRLVPAEEPVSVPPVAESAGFGLIASPSPFRTLINASFSLPESGRVRLTLHDVAGRLVAEVFDGTRPAGRQEIVWRDDAQALRSGVYFLQLRSDGRREVRKILRVR